MKTECKTCVCGNPDGTNIECERCGLIAEIERLKALEPQWLPAGKFPDEDGWWLWRGENGIILPIEVEIDGKKAYWLQGEYRLSFGPYKSEGDRFAKLPKWGGPKD